MGGGWSPTTENGYDLSVVSSSLQKCCRRGAERDGLYWALEMSASVFNGYCWRRLLTITAEDVGLGDPHALQVVNDARARWTKSRMSSKHGRELINADYLPLSEAITYVCRAAKNREGDDLAYLATCLIGEVDEKTGDRLGKNPKTGEIIPPQILFVEPVDDELMAFERSLREKKEYESVYWAYVLREKQREVEVWDKIAEVGTQVQAFVKAAREAREVFWAEKKTPDSNLLCFAILLACRQEYLAEAKPTVPDSYRDDARELLKEVASRRSGIDPATGNTIPRWLCPVPNEAVDGHTERGRGRLKAEAKKSGEPWVLLWNREFYECVARLNRLVEVPGQKNWMYEMCLAAGCDWEKYRAPAPPFTYPPPAPERAKIEDLGDFRYRVESFTEPGVVYSVDPFGRTCNCPFALRNRRPCKHLIAVLRKIWEDRP